MIYKTANIQAPLDRFWALLNVFIITISILLVLPATVFQQTIIPSTLSAGSLDPTFDGDGKFTPPFSSDSAAATAIAIQEDGKIVVAGYVYNVVLGRNEILVLRLNVDG